MNQFICTGFKIIFNAAASRHMGWPSVRHKKIVKKVKQRRWWREEHDGVMKVKKVKWRRWWSVEGEEGDKVLKVMECWRWWSVEVKVFNVVEWWSEEHDRVKKVIEWRRWSSDEGDGAVCCVFLPVTAGHLIHRASAFCTLSVSPCGSDRVPRLILVVLTMSRIYSKESRCSISICNTNLLPLYLLETWTSVRLSGPPVMQCSFM